MHFNLVRSTSRIRALARLGRIGCARKLFDEMPSRDTIAWNAMLSAYSQLGLYQESLNFLHRMRISDQKPDHFSFSSAISACAGSCELKHGQKLHALVILSGCGSSLPVNNSLIDMYAKCRISWNAHQIFSQMTHQNEVSWCSLLFAYTNESQLQIACEIFETMPSKVNIAWNTMISSHARIGDVEFCIDLFTRMLLECSCGVDHWTLSSLMNACTESDKEPLYGLMVHAFILKIGWSLALEVNNSILSFYAKVNSHDDVIKLYESTHSLSQVSWNVIIDAHMKVGEVEKAFLVFQQAPEKNIVSWTSMVSGFARNGHDEKSFSFFVNMMSTTKTGSSSSSSIIRPDGFMFGAILHACSNMTSLERGRMVHGCVIRYGLFSSTYVGNGLVNMYAKCGEIDDSKGAFMEIIEKDIVSWNTMLFGYGLHGKGKLALLVFDEMRECGMKADKVTYIVLLMGCSYSGLIEEGRDVFRSIVNVEMDHVACMVDLLRRGGHLDEARELAEETGFSMKNEEMDYVMLSNLYCANGMWNEAEMMRKIMMDRGLKKLPGCSWIEIKETMTENL